MNHAAYTLVLLVFCLCQSPVLAQLFDDFSDGDITDDPAWIGDTGHFIVNTQGMLQLNAPVGGTSTIYTPVSLPDSAEWRLYYRMAFAPSATNRLRIYLMSDSETLATANGYFIEIGENGGEDALRFFRLNNGAAMEIAASAGIFGGDPSQARLRIRRSTEGLWSFAADLGGGEHWQELFSVEDSVYSLSLAAWFTLQCVYTETRRTLFFFDDIYAGRYILDTVPPGISAVFPLDAQQVSVTFDEVVDTATALEASRYFITPSIGNPSSVAFEGMNGRTVLLMLPSEMQSGTEYSLLISGIGDLAGNTADLSAIFTYIRFDAPQPYDILINEIMADPSPPVGLPNAEYIELYNRSAHNFLLADYTLTVGSQSLLLPAVPLMARAYLTIVRTSEAGLFDGIAAVLPVNLPALTNTGATIEIADDAGNTLHSVSYNLSWYRDGAKDDGGWSLELINPLAPCTLSENWRAAVDLTGGTPGRQNSVTADPVPDMQGPVLQHLFLQSAQVIRSTFNEILDAVAPQITITPQLPISSVAVNGQWLEITLSAPVQAGILYTLMVQGPSDCMGNTGADQSLTFGLPEEPVPGDLYIHEVLFDPAVGGSRFVEVINVSGKFIDMSALIIADIQGDTVSVQPVATQFILYPGAIAAITPSPQDIMMRYFMHDAAQIIVGTLPAFNRTRGNVTVYTRSGVVLDAFDYRADMHNAFLDDRRGVSLERVSTNLNTNAREAWHSAAASAGYATPGLPNSQRLPDITGAGIIEIVPEVFSPDGDGFDDFVTVSFPGVEPGALTTIRVFDAQGRLVVHLAENTSVGVGAIIRWDGSDESGQRARVGVYVLLIELYSAQGKVDRYKRTCVLAERL